MLVAVLHKRIGMNIGDSDVFVNITGGVRVDEPGIDLGIVMAIVSNHRDIAIDPYTVLIGEVGLGGEVRPVANIDKRLREAAKLGFKRAVLPETNRKGLDLTEDIELFGAKNLLDALNILF